MLINGRWLSMAIMTAAVLGCGGKSNPADKIEHDSGVILTITKTANEFLGAAIDEIGLFFENSTNVIDGESTLDVTHVLGIPVDPDDESAGEYADMRILPAATYINALLTPIAFNLNDDVLSYGYDVRIQAVGQPDQVYWSSKDLLDLCRDLPNLSEDLTNAWDDFTAPTSLAEASSWFSTSDERYRACPLEISWRGKDPSEVEAALLNLYNQDHDDEEEGIQNPSTTQVDEVIRALDPIPELQTEGEATFELVVELKMNEFVTAGVYTFTLKVNTVTYDDGS